MGSSGKPTFDTLLLCVSLIRISELLSDLLNNQTIELWKRRHHGMALCLLIFIYTEGLPSGGVLFVYDWQAGSRTVNVRRK